jgi:hypothetical protein
MTDSDCRNVDNREPYIEITNPLLVPEYRFNAKRRQKAFAAGDWKTFVFCVPKPYRIVAFETIERRIAADADYWRLLADIWITTEFPNRDRARWLNFFTSERAQRDRLMTPADHAGLATLPDPFQIFRGAGQRYARGMSWTTDREKAAWFARRFPRSGALFSTVVRKGRVLAYFTERGEAEALIDPRRIRYEVLSRQEAGAEGGSDRYAGEG